MYQLTRSERPAATARPEEAVRAPGPGRELAPAASGSPHTSGAHVAGRSWSRPSVSDDEAFVRDRGIAVAAAIRPDGPSPTYECDPSRCVIAVWNPTRDEGNLLVARLREELPDRDIRLLAHSQVTAGEPVRTIAVATILAARADEASPEYDPLLDPTILRWQDLLRRGELPE
jgi:hypothetical protein